MGKPTVRLPEMLMAKKVPPRTGRWLTIGLESISQETPTRVWRSGASSEERKGIEKESVSW